MLKRFFSKIPAHIYLLLKLYVLNLVLFFIVRLFFYFINQSLDVSTVSFFEKLQAFRIGLEFDTSVICWITYIPALMWSLAYSFRIHKLYHIGYFIFSSLLLVYYFVACADIPYFKQFGNHLNRGAFLWNDSPDFAVGVIFGSFSYWGYFFLFGFLAFLLLRISKRLKNNFQIQIKEEQKPKWYYSLLSFILLMGFITLGARGRPTDRSGLHEGVAIVSQNNFVNQIAINPNFTFWKSVLLNNKKTTYAVPNNINDKIAFTRNYLNISTPFEPTISRTITDTASAKTKYNFVIVVMESMSLFKMGYYNGGNFTPHLNKLIKESVFFNHFFSSGIHTFNGLFSTTSGFPSIYDEQPLKSYTKQAFDGLGTLLHQQGYENYSYTTHDPHFDNMQGFFKLNRFDHFISEYDFDFTQSESSLGVPDHVLFDKLIETTNNRKSNKPFLQVVMTASDHGPWKIPTNIPFKPTGNTPQENCTLYADWSIGRFMDEAKKQSWYKNTVFIFLGDHGLSMGHTYEMPLSYNHVPCVIHQPILFKADTITSPCYQPDIPATVMGIIGANYTNNTFGINILKEKHPFVVFSADDKVGCVDDKGFYYYKTLSNNQQYLRIYKDLDPANYLLKYPQKADSMENAMMNIYESANYFIHKSYFLYEQTD